MKADHKIVRPKSVEAVPSIEEIFLDFAAEKVIAEGDVKTTRHVTDPKQVEYVLKNAVKSGNLDIAEDMLKKGGDPNMDFSYKVPSHNKKSNGMSHSTLLTTAIARNDYEMVELLINYGADVNKENGVHYTPLQQASSDHVDIKIAHLLLEYGANVHAKCKFGHTVMETASIGGGNIPFMKLMRKHGAEIELISFDDRLFDIINNEKPNKELIQKHMEARVKNLKLMKSNGVLNSSNKNKMLDEVAKAGCSAGVDFLFKTFDFTKTEKNNLANLLITTVRKGFCETSKCLVENGVEINGKDYHGKTALMYTSENGHAKLAQFLIQNGADKNIKDKNGKIAVDLAKNFTTQLAIKQTSAVGEDTALQQMIKNIKHFVKTRV